MLSIRAVSVFLAACLLSTLNGTSATSFCTTGQVNRTKVICDNNNKPWKPCGADQASDYKLTCAEVEDQPGLWSTYKYACCPEDSHPTAACAAGLCPSAQNLNRDAIICDNKEAGSPCGSDQHAEMVLTCGEIHDQITWGQRTPCGTAATDYRNAHPQCCGSLTDDTAAIIGAAVGGVLGLCCLVGGAGGVVMMLRKRKVVGVDMEAGQKSAAQPVLQTYPAAPAPQLVMQQQQVPQPVTLQQQLPQPTMPPQQVPAAIFCERCGARNESATFCAKCGGRL